MNRTLWVLMGLVMLNSSQAATSECENPSIGAKEIAGLYRQSVNGLPANIGQSGEKLQGYNYLAISPLTGNQVRVRLSTKEINGHDCGLDNAAILCGKTIRIIPSEEERVILESRELPAPSMRITKNQIAFIPYDNGNFVWGSPYCGSMGYLRHSFSRSTRKIKFDESIFDQ